VDALLSLLGVDRGGRVRGVWHAEEVERRTAVTSRKLSSSGAAARDPRASRLGPSLSGSRRMRAHSSMGSVGLLPVCDASSSRPGSASRDSLVNSAHRRDCRSRLGDDATTWPLRLRAARARVERGISGARRRTRKGRGPRAIEAGAERPPKLRSKSPTAHSRS